MKVSHECHAPLFADCASELALAPEQRFRADLLRHRRMLSPQTQTNLKNAKSYFEEHLAAGDYYAEAERVWWDNGLAKARKCSASTASSPKATS
jgi:hypothetical protein